MEITISRRFGQFWPKHVRWLQNRLSVFRHPMKQTKGNLNKMAEIKLFCRTLHFSTYLVVFAQLMSLKKTNKNV